MVVVVEGGLGVRIGVESLGIGEGLLWMGLGMEGSMKRGVVWPVSGPDGSSRGGVKLEVRRRWWLLGEFSSSKASKSKLGERGGRKSWSSSSTVARLMMPSASFHSSEDWPWTRS